LLRKHVTELRSGEEPAPQAREEGEIVSTYTQDTVFRIRLNEHQRKAFGQAVASTVVNSGDQGPQERELMVRQTCETFEVK
jgi:hypothetical protein